MLNKLKVLLQKVEYGQVHVAAKILVIMSEIILQLWNVATVVACYHKNFFPLAKTRSTELYVFIKERKPLTLECYSVLHNGLW